MCDHHALDRRSLLIAGAGITTTAALATVAAPANAAETTTVEFSGTFTGIGTPDWHYLPFEVPAGVRAIAVSYEYASTSTPLGFSVNVIDIGIFDPNGFRGWSGGARKTFRVATDAATPGYLAGPITPGTWRVILGPFAIIPPGVVVDRDGHARVRRPRGPGVRPEHRAPPGRRHRCRLVPRRPAHPHRPLRRQPHPGQPDRARQGGRARLHRLLGAQHQLRRTHLGCAHARRTSWSSSARRSPPGSGTGRRWACRPAPGSTGATGPRPR